MNGKSNQINRTRGFTLIELIIVIAVLGILSAFAIARYADLQDQAELNSIKYTASNLVVSIQNVKVLFFSQGFSTRTQNLVGIANDIIDTNNIGYPIGISKGNGTERVNASGCEDLWRNLLTDAPSVERGNDNSDYRAYRHTAGTFCSFAYRKNGDTAGRNQSQIVIRYDSTTGKVDVCGRSADLPNC